MSRALVPQLLLVVLIAMGSSSASAQPTAAAEERLDAPAPAEAPEEALAAAAPAPSAAAPAPSAAAPAASTKGTKPGAGDDQEPDPTEQLFADKCGSCHTVGKGVRVGPDLAGAHQRRGHDWLVSMISTPDKMLASDPTARQLLAKHNNVRMPNLGLTAEQVESLIALIERCSSEPCNLVGKFVPVTQATDADVARGRRLFLGLERLAHGGPPCVSCHTARGMASAFGGGTLARDLSHAFARLGDEGIDAALRNPSFPLMKNIFVGDRALAKDEAFALRAFLDRSNRVVSAKRSGLSLALVGALGALAILILLNLAWSRRMRGVRVPLTRSGRAAR